MTGGLRVIVDFTGNISDIHQMSTTIKYHVLYREIKGCLPLRFGNKQLQLISLMLLTFTISTLLCVLGNFACYLSSVDFFQNQLFQKILSGIPSECQTDSIQIRPNILSGLIWVQILQRLSAEDKSPLTRKELYQPSLCKASSSPSTTHRAVSN